MPTVLIHPGKAVLTALVLAALLVGCQQIRLSQSHDLSKAQGDLLRLVTHARA